jgi:hypothetical protein
MAVQDINASNASGGILQSAAPGDTRKLVMVSCDEVANFSYRAAVRWKPIAAIGAAAVAAAILATIVIGALRSRASQDAQTTQTAQPAEPRRAVAVAVAPRGDPYGEAIQARDTELTRCATMHGERLPEDTRAIVRIGADGRALSVAFTPSPTERSALASCIRDVLAATIYPTAKVEELALAVRR